MNSKEVLHKQQEAVVNVIKSLKSAIEERKYGTLEHRKYAYGLLRDRFSKLFLDNSEKVGTLHRDKDTKRIIFEWDQIGWGRIDEKDGVYKFHVTSNRFGQKETIWGDRVKEKHTQLDLNLDDATITDYVQTRTMPPEQYTDFPFPIVSESKHKTTILDVETVLDLIEGLNTVEPRIDTWLANYPGREDFNHY